MALIEWLNQIDTQMLLGINGCNNNFFDHFFTLFTNKVTWYPLYLFIVFIIIDKYKLKGFWIILFIVIAIVISDQLSGLCKDMVQRLRPSHQPLLTGKLNLPTGEGGSYGYFSGHATNSFALAVLLGLLSRSRRLWAAFVIWAIFTAYSRIYVGVHYPFDVLTGAVVGSLIGLSVYKLLIMFDDRFLRQKIIRLGRWKSVHSNLLLVALCFITVTIFVVAKLIEV